MKSLVLVEPHKLVLEERPVPVPGPAEVLIRIKAASICHTDFFTLNGEYPDCKYPTVLCHEFSGIIEQCGRDLKYLKPGARVACMGYVYCGRCPFCRRGLQNRCRHGAGIPFHLDGAYQEMVCVPEVMVYPIGDSMSFAEAALIEPAANGYAVADQAAIYPGENVVVIGPGPIGLLALQSAKLKSAGLLLMLGTRPERLKLAVNLGATETVNVRDADAHAAIMDMTCGRGADVVLLCAGTEDAWNLSGSILAPYGRVIVEALPPERDIRWTVPVFDFTAKAISYTGVSGFTAGQFGTALELVQSKKIDVKALITHRFALEEYEEAFETSDKRKGGAIKVIFEM